MTKTKNKGEVSELYSFVYILANQLVPVVNGALSFTGEQVAFESLRREDKEYQFVRDKSDIKIFAKGDTFYISRDKFKESANEILRLLLGKESAIQEDDEYLKRVLKLLHTDKISAKSSEKIDFSAQVSLPGTSLPRFLGFSVKSNIGQDPTLINANKENSRIQFRITKDNENPKKEEMEPFLNSALPPKKLIHELLKSGYSLTFTKMFGEALDYNLKMIDSYGPQLVSRVLLEAFYYQKTKKNFASLIRAVAEKQDIPAVRALGENKQDCFVSLKYKIQNFLLAFTTGATVSKKWNGMSEASGGFIIVTKNGEVCCLELATRNAIAEYLVNFSYFENPSTKRHGYGEIYQTGSAQDYFIDLQLQVRITNNLSS